MMFGKDPLPSWEHQGEELPKALAAAANDAASLKPRLEAVRA